MGNQKIKESLPKLAATGLFLSVMFIFSALSLSCQDSFFLEIPIQLTGEDQDAASSTDTAPNGNTPSDIEISAKIPGSPFRQLTFLDKTTGHFQWHHRLKFLKTIPPTGPPAA